MKIVSIAISKKKGTPKTPVDEAFDALAAIGADAVGAGLGQRLGGVLGGGAHHGAVLVLAGVEDHAGDDREPGFASGLDGDSLAGLDPALRRL